MHAPKNINFSMEPKKHIKICQSANMATATLWVKNIKQDNIFQPFSLFFSNMISCIFLEIIIKSEGVTLNSTLIGANSTLGMLSNSLFKAVGLVRRWFPSTQKGWRLHRVVVDRLLLGDDLHRIQCTGT